jgi:hypothetical protein
MTHDYTVVFYWLIGATASAANYESVSVWGANRDRCEAHKLKNRNIL